MNTITAWARNFAASLLGISGALKTFFFDTILPLFDKNRAAILSVALPIAVKLVLAAEQKYLGKSGFGNLKMDEVVTQLGAALADDGRLCGEELAEISSGFLRTIGQLAWQKLSDEGVL
jgi:hypothetical protein